MLSRRWSISIKIGPDLSFAWHAWVWKPQVGPRVTHAVHVCTTPRRGFHCTCVSGVVLDSGDEFSLAGFYDAEFATKHVTDRLQSNG